MYETEPGKHTHTHWEEGGVTETEKESNVCPAVHWGKGCNLTVRCCFFASPLSRLADVSAHISGWKHCWLLFGSSRGGSWCCFSTLCKWWILFDLLTNLSHTSSYTAGHTVSHSLTVDSAFPALSHHLSLCFFSHTCLFGSIVPCLSCIMFFLAVEGHHDFNYICATLWISIREHHFDHCETQSHFTVKFILYLPKDKPTADGQSSY